MLSGINPSISDEINRQSSAIDKRREQLRRWNESETNHQSSNIKLSKRVKFEQAYIFLSACSSEDLDEIDKLLKDGVDINTSNIDGLTALHQSSIDNNLNMVEYLINKNADINCQDNEGWTPLHAAASSGNFHIVKYLLLHGAIVDLCNNEGELPIDITEDDQIIEYLKNDMRIKEIDEQQSRNYEHQLMIKHLQDLFYLNKNNFKTNPDVIVHLRTGATALHVAAAKGYLDVIEILIDAGANVNSIDNDGWTPLHAAAYWDKHDIIKYLFQNNADFNIKNYAGQTPFDVCHGQTFQLLKELKDKQSIIQSNIDENSSNLKNKLTNLQQSLNDLNNLYSKSNQEQSLLNCSNNQKIYTNPLQSLTTNNFNNNSFNYNNSSNVQISSSPSNQSLDSKINPSINETHPEVPPRRWGTNDRTVGDIPNNTGPYVRRQSAVSVNESTPSTVISVTSSSPPPPPSSSSSSSTTNVTVTSSSSTNINEKRINRDDEAEAQRKHRSAQARRERRSTQSVTLDDIKAAEQQIKIRSNENNNNNNNELLNNKIGAPSIPSINNEHDIETEHLQKIIEDKKDKIRNETNTKMNLTDDIPTINANDSLNLLDSQQKRRINRVHNQKKNTGRIIWNDQTKQVEIREYDQQQSSSSSPSLQSRFDNNSTIKTIRSRSQEPTQKLQINAINSNNDSTIIHLYEETKRKIDDINKKIQKLEKDIYDRDQIIEKLKTSQYIESSLDKREKRSYERKISELEEDFKKLESIKADNTRLKEENAALIRVISKLSK